MECRAVDREHTVVPVEGRHERFYVEEREAVDHRPGLKRPQNAGRMRVDFDDVALPGHRGIDAASGGDELAGSAGKGECADFAVTAERVKGN